MDAVRDTLEAVSEGLGGRLALVGERGSRAFGTEGPGSDHDVVAYLVWPPREYLRLRPPAPTYGTRKSGEVSVTPFELRRALSDALRSNVTVWTVANSLALHVDEAGFRERLLDLSLRAHHDRSALFQYANFTASAVRKVLKPGHAPPKAWLHVLQPLLSFRHVRERSAPAPVAFAELLAESGSPAMVEASTLSLEAKRSGGAGLQGSLALAVLEEAQAVAEEARSLGDSERLPNPDLVEEADAIAWDVTEAMAAG